MLIWNNMITIWIYQNRVKLSPLRRCHFLLCTWCVPCIMPDVRSWRSLENNKSLRYALHCFRQKTGTEYTTRNLIFNTDCYLPNSTVSTSSTLFPSEESKTYYFNRNMWAKMETKISTDRGWVLVIFRNSSGTLQYKGAEVESQREREKKFRLIIHPALPRTKAFPGTFNDKINSQENWGYC